jgi:hypothetical protein
MTEALRRRLERLEALAPQSASGCTCGTPHGPPAGRVIIWDERKGPPPEVPACPVHETLVIVRTIIAPRRPAAE